MSNGVAITMFIIATLGSIFSIYLYRAIKKQEDEGLEIATPSQAVISWGIYLALGALIFLLYLLGVYPPS